MPDLHELTLTRASEGLQRKEFSSLELTLACLARIEATEPKINACTSVLAEYALDRAKALDAAGPGSGMPLWGVPLMLKDLIWLKGFPTTCSSNLLRHFLPPGDAETAARLKAAGAVIVAKNNMDEFAMGSSTESSAFGRTRNPWDLDKTPGGSSGGSAAGVAACQAFGSLGSDTGGSIRQPAALCGCVGIKPSYGLVSRHGAVAFAASCDQLGPMARTVEDAARILDVIAGHDPKDPACARPDALPPLPSSRHFAQAAREAAGKEPKDVLKGLVLGLPQEMWDLPLEPDVAENCRALLSRLEDAGALLLPLSLPRQRYAAALYRIISSAEASVNLSRPDGRIGGCGAEDAAILEDAGVTARSRGFGPEARFRLVLGAFVRSGRRYDGWYRKAAQIRRLLREDFDRALERCDLLVAPSCTRTAWTFDAGPGGPEARYAMDSLTVGLNLAGLPGLALPVGLGGLSGMPVGIQLMGRPFDEYALIRAGAAVEKLTPCLPPPRALDRRAAVLSV